MLLWLYLPYQCACVCACMCHVQTRRCPLAGRTGTEHCFAWRHSAICEVDRATVKKTKHTFMLAAMQPSVMRLPAGMLHTPPGHPACIQTSCACMGLLPHCASKSMPAGLQPDARSRVEGAELAWLCISHMAMHGPMQLRACLRTCLPDSSLPPPVHALPVNCLYTTRAPSWLLGFPHLCPHGVPLCACIARLMPIALTTIAAP